MHTPKLKIKRDLNPKNPVINVLLGPVLWSCSRLFMSAEATFFPPCAWLSVLLLGLVVRRKSSWGFSENESWLPFSQLNTRRLTLLKTSTSASGLGQRERRRGTKRQEKTALLHFKSSNSKLGFFGINSQSSSSMSRRVSTAFHRRPLFRPALGNHMRQEGEWKEMAAIVGSKAWMWWSANCTGPCWAWIKSTGHFFAHHLGLKSATRMLMLLKLSSKFHCTGKNGIYFGLRNL